MQGTRTERTDSASSSPEAASRRSRPRSRSDALAVRPRRRRARRARAPLLVPTRRRRRAVRPRRRQELRPRGHGLAVPAPPSRSARSRPSTARQRHRSHRGRRCDPVRRAPRRVRRLTRSPPSSGAITFRGPSDSVEIEHLLDALETGEVHRVVFAVPAGSGVEPAALRARADDRRARRRPRARRRGAHARHARGPAALPLRRRRERRRRGAPRRRGHRGPHRRLPRRLRGRPPRPCCRTAASPADHVVALPRLYVPPLGGVPQTYEGFVPVDRHGRVVRASLASGPPATPRASP